MLQASDGSEMGYFVSESVLTFIRENPNEYWEIHMDATYKTMPYIGASQLFIIHINFERTVS